MINRLTAIFRVISLHRRAGALSRLMLFLLAFPAFAQGPAWWTERGVVNTNQPNDDYVGVNLGQLKWMATNAYAEMVESFSVSTNLDTLIGTNLPALISSFNPPNTDNYFLANLGQVENVAQPFYDRLNALNLTNTLPANMPGAYPWGGGPTTNDYALANIGQLKYVFSFDSAVDTDGDELTDWEEAGWGTSPYNPDTDGDGLSDGWEIANGKNPLDSNDANPEASNMLETVRQRVIQYWLLYWGTAPSFTNAPGSAADLSDVREALNSLSEKFYKVE